MADARRKVLLIGWDAADWKVIRPLMDAGRMPNIQRLINAGSTARLTTLQPSFSPMLWTSIATGKRPFDHGIHGFTEPRPDGRGVQRVTNLARRCKALWNILGQNNLRSIVVGWWPSYPAEPIRGAMVSDQFHRAVSDFKYVSGMVHPKEYGESLCELRLNPDELPLDVIELLVPRAKDVDQEKDHRLRSAAKIAAECANIQNTATWLMDREPWDLCAVYFDAIDHFGHGFMKFNPPRRPAISAISDADFDLYRQVLQSGYQLHDKMLGTLLEKAGSDATVILISDHGFHPDHLRPTSIPQFHAGPASEHRNNGILVAAGPGIKQGVEVPGVNLLDITPTVLTLFDLPVADDMEGKTITSIFDTPPARQRIPSWEKIEGEDGRHPPHMQLDPVASTESLEQLVALGYVEEPDADDDKAAKRTLGDLRTNLAEAYQDAGRHAEALEILQELREADPNDQRAAFRLFISALALRNTSQMEAIAADWNGRRREDYGRAFSRLEELRASARERVLQRPERDTTEPLLSPQERTELRLLRGSCRYDSSLTVYFEAQLAVVKKQWTAALARLDRIPSGDLIRPGHYIDRAAILTRLNRLNDAETALRTGLEIDPEDARLHLGLSRLFLARGDFESAAHAALDGLALLNQEPRGHYFLGIALARLHRFDAATAAFRRALAVNPDFPQALLWLAHIHSRYLEDPERAANYSRLRQMLRNNLPGPEESAQQRAPELGPRPVAFAASARDLPPITDEIVVVSGLPRSGTSMLMQMLVAGGMTPLTDGLRQPDEDNPRGYFEFEPVRQMAQDNSWVEQARGKVVKVVAPLLQHLPDGIPCRVILIERDINDILASQRSMISRRAASQPAQRVVDQTSARLERLKSEYLRLIVWTKGFVAGRPATKLMCVDRAAVLRDPEAASKAMNRFLGGGLDTFRMAGEVRPELGRQSSVQLSTSSR
jgi:predicted AlkP superfamily phosphohydrolase/phosphomutase/tetratricopeptide (TPR) repeat protein